MSCCGENWLVPGADPNNGGGGGSGTVTSVGAGTGINITGTATDPIVNNTGVLSIGNGGGINITGTATDPIVNNTGVLSIGNGEGITISGTASDPIVTNNGLISLTAGTNITLGGTSTDPIINAAAGTVPRPTNVIYVSPNGNDTTADGTVSLPFLTIQAAITFRNTLDPNALIEIFIFPGSYTIASPLTVNRGNTFFNAFPSQYANYKTVILNVSSVIVDITVLTGAASVQVGFSNIEWTSVSISSSTALAQSIILNFTNCSINGYASHDDNTSTTNVVTYTDCTFINFTANPVITNNGCLLKILRCEISYSVPNVVGILITGVSPNLNLQYSNITGLANGLQDPIVQYTNTGASTANVFLYNTLRFTSLSTDTGTDKCCIQYNGIGSVVTDIITSNTLISVGSVYGSGGVGFCVQKRGAGAVTHTLSGRNNVSGFFSAFDLAITVTHQVISNS